MCQDSQQQYRLTLALKQPGKTDLTPKYLFGTAREVIEAGGSSFFPYPRRIPNFLPVSTCPKAS